MHPLLLSLPFALIVTAATAHDHSHDRPSSLSAHEHGAAELDAVLDGQTLEIELRSPAINLLGFEQAPRSAAEQDKLADTRAQLQRPDTLLGLPVAARCELTDSSLESPLFGGEAEGTHADIQARYRYSCEAPQALSGLNLRGLFEAFPGTEKIQAQIIGPNGQQGRQLRAEQAQITF